MNKPKMVRKVIKIKKIGRIKPCCVYVQDSAAKRLWEESFHDYTRGDK